MSFGKNLQFLRRMYNGMTQEDLAEKMNVSRQTISKWELGSVYPEIDKVIELCRLFSCSMDNLIQEDMDMCDEAYSNIRVKQVDKFSYLRYAVISMEPEEDAVNHVKQWIRGKNESETISCFEKEYMHEDKDYMDVYIAVK